MTIDRLVLLPLAAGHVSLFVYAVNVLHGLGYSEDALKRTRSVLFALFAVGGVYLCYEIYQGSVDTWSWPVVIYGLVCLMTAMLLVPLSSAYLHLRPRPQPVDAWTTEVQLDRGVERASLIGQGRHHWMLRLPGNEAFQLNKHEWDVTVTRLPAALDGLSVLHFSDLHLATCYNRSYFERVFDQFADFDADLVLFTGDLVDDDASRDWIVPLFERLRGRLGQYAVLGNHDAKHDPMTLNRLLSQAGFTPLDGSWAVVESKGARIALAGTSYPWGPKPDPAERPMADLRILLSHVPDMYYWACRHDFDLMLSGHNHGGQIRLPCLGAVFMPSLYSRRFDRGFFTKGPLTLHVSQGIGSQHPYRWGCVPEVGRLVLRAPVVRRTANWRSVMRDSHLNAPSDFRLCEETLTGPSDRPKLRWIAVLS